ncbi:MAG: hypothetical protein F6K22_33785 [Okeania sp. SIO2F4]|nr:hypothetical protein [Okeania sp. SIO2F4]
MVRGAKYLGFAQCGPGGKCSSGLFHLKWCVRSGVWSGWEVWSGWGEKDT